MANPLCSMTDPRPILVFDSGVGGLSILERIRAFMPQASVVYAADNAWHPYGPRTEQEIAARVPALLGRLCERYHPRLIVIACNTAATIALADVRAALDLPVVGTVPAIKPAAIASISRVIGVLGTNATVRQPYVDRLIAEFATDCTVLRLGSSDLVRIAEAKLRGVAPDHAELHAVMQQLYGQSGGDAMDQVVLACTHFPLLRDDLAAVSPDGMKFVDSGDGIARRTQFLLQGQEWASPATGIAVFTKDSEDLVPLRPALERYGLATLDIL